MPPPKTSQESFNNLFSLAVKTEESAEKWVTRDEPKAQRFYVQAIELYQTCCNQQPLDFDSAYNLYIARSRGFTIEQVRLLETSITLHKAAINLEENADALFNLAECTSSLSEAVDDQLRSRNLLIESVKLFEKCLLMQETPRQDSIEPVTVDTILDTLFAIVDSRSRLLRLASREVQDLEYADDVLLERAQHISLETHRIDEYYLVRAELVASRAFFQVCIGQATLSLVDEAIRQFDDSVQGQCNKADFLIDLSNFLIGEGNYMQSWVYLGDAAATLLCATRMKPTMYSLWDTYGEVELQRARLPQVSVMDKTTFLTNAKEFFSKAIDRCKIERISAELEVKFALVLVELGDPEGLERLNRFERERLKSVLESIQEGLFPVEMYKEFMV